MGNINMNYKSRSQLAEIFGISTQTVDNRIKEIQSEVAAGRYGPHSVLKDVGYVAVNLYVFADYMTYRARLRNKNLRKSVPPYNAFEIAREFKEAI
jgi:hypothetical protein